MERNANRRLFFDIETSFNIGWFWRAGFNQSVTTEQIIEERKIICVSWKWEGEDQVHHLTWDRNKCDKKLLERFMKEMAKADEVIAHNGDRFDIKWLRTRCLYHRLPAFPYYQSLDTLKAAKSHFNFQSNRLDYIAKFLGVGEKMETGGIDLWKKVVIDNDPDALQQMVDYCDQDVVILEKVFIEMKNFIRHKTHFGVLKDDKKFRKFLCPECGSPHQHLNKTYSTAMGTIKRHLRCGNCGKNRTVSNKTYMDLLKFQVKNVKNND